MWDSIFELGVAKELSIFFFLFVLLSCIFYKFVRDIMAQNEARELRYLDTIENLTGEIGPSLKIIKEDIKKLKEEIREEIRTNHKGLKWYLDRLIQKNNGGGS